MNAFSEVNLEVCLILVLCLTSQCSSECFTKVTDGGTSRPEKCVFPFIYRSRRFESCTQMFDPDVAIIFTFLLTF